MRRARWTSPHACERCGRRTCSRTCTRSLACATVAPRRQCSLLLTPCSSHLPTSSQRAGPQAPPTWPPWRARQLRRATWASKERQAPAAGRPSPCARANLVLRSLIAPAARSVRFCASSLGSRSGSQATRRTTQQVGRTAAGLRLVDLFRSQTAALVQRGKEAVLDTGGAAPPALLAAALTRQSQAWAQPRRDGCRPGSAPALFHDTPVVWCFFTRNSGSFRAGVHARAQSTCRARQGAKAHGRCATARELARSRPARLIWSGSLS